MKSLFFGILFLFQLAQAQITLSADIPFEVIDNRFQMANLMFDNPLYKSDLYFHLAVIRAVSDPLIELSRQTVPVQNIEGTLHINFKKVEIKLTHPSSVPAGLISQTEKILTEQLFASDPNNILAVMSEVDKNQVTPVEISKSLADLEIYAFDANMRILALSGSVGSLLLYNTNNWVVFTEAGQPIGPL